ncbi:hypothetical protein RB2654_15070 [Rhodobacterales bacterium HTCC2654]|uniref:Uncharacterized protein n=1 Tax=Maritimibacter alkaliphilus HTCC2654 TaxID=314271 RepID=A3VH63_9RHOB|nr:hypothetical protein RB2654_15070 [Rhodobacterales bacterium HTCC2654] [Maritimibacter alkaliphilus HTCC2654]
MPPRHRGRPVAKPDRALRDRAAAMPRHDHRRGWLRAGSNRDRRDAGGRWRPDRHARP